MPEPAPLDYEPVTTRRGRSLVPWVVGIAVVTVMISVLLPSLGKQRYSPNRVTCASSLRQIGQAIAKYASENMGQYPSDMGLLIRTQALAPGAFVCPSSDDVVLQASPQQQAATLLSGGHCSYVYVGAGMTNTAGSDEVVAFEMPDNHSRQGGNVLYGDGHVSFEMFDGLVQLVPTLEAGRNPPLIGPLTAEQAKAMYEQKWLPKLASIKDGTWAASLPQPATQPGAEAK